MSKFIDVSGEHKQPTTHRLSFCRWNPKDNENEEGSVDDISGSEAGDDSVPPLEGLYEEPEPERGPPILTPISEDLEVHGQIPWIIRQYKRGRYLRVSSLLWPGAHTVAREG